MNVPEELKLNKFKQVNLPQNIEYVRRFGLGQKIPDSYTEEMPNFENRKTETTYDEKFLTEMQEKFEKENQN